jgi:hypothetical protein
MVKETAKDERQSAREATHYALSAKHSGWVEQITKIDLDDDSNEGSNEADKPGAFAVVFPDGSLLVNAPDGKQDAKVSLSVNAPDGKQDEKVRKERITDPGELDEFREGSNGNEADKPGAFAVVCPDGSLSVKAHYEKQDAKMSLSVNAPDGKQDEKDGRSGSQRQTRLSLTSSAKVQPSTKRIHQVPLLSTATRLITKTTNKLRMSPRMTPSLSPRMSRRISPSMSPRMSPRAPLITTWTWWLLLRSHLTMGI